jgi:hypothetical protein
MLHGRGKGEFLKGSDETAKRKEAIGIKISARMLEEKGVAKTCLIYLTIRTSGGFS